MARGRSTTSAVGAAAAFLVVALGPTSASGSVPRPDARAMGTTRVSVSSSGAQGDDNSISPALSSDGRFVAFLSNASNLVPGDTNQTYDEFIRDRWRGTTRLVSVSSHGTRGNGGSGDGAVSANGRFVAFTSDASNLVRGDTNGYPDVFVRDRWRGTTRRVSVGAHGAQADSDSESGSSEISANGRFVAFISFASNLVVGDTNQNYDVFVRDRWRGTTRRVSVGAHGAQADGYSYPAGISANGRFVAFVSSAANLTPGDSGQTWDVFVRDRWTGTTTRASVAPPGTPSTGDKSAIAAAISASGRFVAFDSSATNLVPGDTNGRTDVFVRNLRDGTTRRVSIDTAGDQGNGASSRPVISGDGRFVVFTSVATNLAPGLSTNGDINLFVRDRRSGTTERLLSGPVGTADDGGIETAMSADGRFVAFDSPLPGLVPGDTNNVSDVFVQRRGVR
jgi:Tol biopolymer transport system component